MNSSKRSLNRKQIESQFDRAASTYDSVADLQRRMGRQLVKRVCESGIPKQDPLIDLGCGTGEILYELSQDGFTQLSGLDLSSQMLSLAIKKAPEASMIHADIENVPSNDGAFRTVVSNAALQWCDTETAVQEISRIMMPGGNLFLNVFVQGTLAQWELAFKSLNMNPRVHKLPCIEKIESTIEATGFKITSSEPKIETTAFNSIESMFDSIRKLGATNATDSRNRPLNRKEYIALKKYFLESLERGKLELDFAWVNISAKK